MVPRPGFTYQAKPYTRHGTQKFGLKIYPQKYPLIDDADNDGERDFIILGDMNIQDCDELAQATPTGFVSLNDECVGHAVDENEWKKTSAADRTVAP